MAWAPSSLYNHKIVSVHDINTKFHTYTNNSIRKTSGYSAKLYFDFFHIYVTITKNSFYKAVEFGYIQKT